MDNITTPDIRANITDSTAAQSIGVGANSEGVASNYIVYIIAIAALLFTIFIISRRKGKTTKKEIGIVGERGSGKTQLFLRLAGGKSFETVPSIVNNNSQLLLGEKKYHLIDYIGDNLSKDQVISQIARFHTLVHVIDGTDSKKLGDAALFVYRILINKLFQKDPCNYVIFLNKSDEKSFHGVQKLVKRIEDEIETIKVTRRNLTEQNEQGEEDYIRNQRTRFDLKKQEIKIIVGSSREDHASLMSALEELCS